MGRWLALLLALHPQFGDCWKFHCVDSLSREECEVDPSAGSICNFVSWAQRASRSGSQLGRHELEGRICKNARTTCGGSGMVYPCLSLAGKQHDALLTRNVGHGGLNLSWWLDSKVGLLTGFAGHVWSDRSAAGQQRRLNYFTSVRSRLTSDTNNNNNNNSNNSNNNIYNYESMAWCALQTRTKTNARNNPVTNYVYIIHSWSGSDP